MVFPTTDGMKNKNETIKQGVQTKQSYKVLYAETGPVTHRNAEENTKNAS